MAHTTDQLLESINRLGAQQLGVLRLIQGVVGQINGQLKAGKSGGTAAPRPKPKADQEAGPSILSRLGAVTGAVGAVVGALASIPAAIVGIIKTANSFVRALNPSLVEQYERQVENLTATIGYGLTPIVAYATRSVKQFAEVILPAVQRVKPLVDQLAHAVSGAAGGAFRLLGTIAQQVVRFLAPLMPIVAATVENLANFADVVSAAIGALVPFQTVTDALTYLLNANLGGLRAFATALAVTSARLLATFGGADALNRFKAGLAKAIEDRKKAPVGGLLAAPKDATTGGIEDVLRRMNERAFISGAGAETKAPDVAALEEILKEVQGIEPKNWKDVIKDAVKDALREYTPGGAVVGGATDLISGRGASTDGRPRSSALGPLGGLIFGGG